MKATIISLINALTLMGLFPLALLILSFFDPNNRNDLILLSLFSIPGITLLVINDYLSEKWKEEIKKVSAFKRGAMGIGFFIALYLIWYFRHDFVIRPHYFKDEVEHFQTKTKKVKSKVDHHCLKDSDQYRCTVKYFQEMYSQHYRETWKIIRKAENEAFLCNGNTDAMVKFLSLSNAIGGNAETVEYFSEKVETIALNKPQCLLSGLVESNDHIKEQVSGYLLGPTFNKPEKILKSLNIYRTDKKYNELFNAYFSKKSKSSY